MVVIMVVASTVVMVVVGSSTLYIHICTVLFLYLQRQTVHDSKLHETD
jgi:hypothetical protein